MACQPSQLDIPKALLKHKLTRLSPDHIKLPKWAQLGEHPAPAPTTQLALLLGILHQVPAPQDAPAVYSPTSASKHYAGFCSFFCLFFKEKRACNWKQKTQEVRLTRAAISRGVKPPPEETGACGGLKGAKSGFVLTLFQRNFVPGSKPSGGSRHGARAPPRAGRGLRGPAGEGRLQPALTAAGPGSR